MSADEDLVAAELAHLDATADNYAESPNDRLAHAALYAFARAYALRRLPVEAAAATLRAEAMKALTGQGRWVSNRWPMASFHLRMATRWAELPPQVTHMIPRDDEMRLYVRRHPRAPGKVFPKRRPCHGSGRDER